jgi:hypothetical protein
MSADNWRILQIAGRMIRWSRLSGLVDRFGFGTTEGPTVDESIGEKPNAQPVRIAFPPGYRCIQDFADGECLMLSPRGNVANAVAVLYDNCTYGPTDLEKNEPVICDKAGSVVRFYADGSIKITGKSGAYINIDKDGNVDVIPSASGNIRLGTIDSAKLSHVALYEALKTQFDSLASVVNGLIAAYNAHAGHGTGGPPPTYASSASNLTSAVASPNVYAKDKI